MEATMTSEDGKRATWTTYVTAWNATTRQAKEDALAASVNPRCSYRDPTMAVEGSAALVEAMLGFHRQIPGAHFETTYFLAHHDRSIARWNLLSGDGAVLGDGIS